jgi:DNA-binding transcriptional LysR family regulator
MNTTEAPVVNQSVTKSAERAPLAQSIAELIGVKTSAVAFADLRDAARSLGMSAKRKSDGTVGSVDPVARSVFTLLLARFAKHAPVTRGQLMELVGIARTLPDGEGKGVDGAIYFKDGAVKGDSATLGSLKVRPAFAAGNVSLD